ncbi:MAG: copper resistance CopC/CopD family protein [Ktedonobacteraceae bacterium]
MKSRHLRYLKLVLVPALLLNIVIYCIAVVILQPQAALAHAYVVGSEPVDGSTVTTAPRVIRMYFNANVSAMSVTQVLYVQNGDYVSVPTHSTLATNNPRELDTFLPTTIGGGSYLVRWTAVANDDGHTTFGSIGFDIGRSSTGVQGTPTLGPSSSNCVGNTCATDIRKLDLLGILAVAWEWLVMAALTLWIGILVTERIILVRTERVIDLLDRARRQALPIQWLCLAALLVGEIVTLSLRSVHITRALNNGVLDFSSLPALLTETLYGRLWIVRSALIILALVLLWWMTRPRQVEEGDQNAQRVISRTGPLRLQQAGSLSTTTGSIKALAERTPLPTTTAQLQRHTGLWFLLAVLIVCTYALTENTVSVIQPHISAILLSGLSLLAQCIWFGGLAYLGYVVLPLLSIVDLDSNTETIVAFLRRMTPFILGSIGVQLVSLLFLSETTIPAPQLLLDDPYGRSLLVRLILVALALLVSLYILFILRPRLTRQTLLLPVVDAELPARRTRQSALERTTRQMRTLVNIHALLGGGVLLCATLMAFYAPPIVFPDTPYANPPAAATGTPTTANNTQQQKVGNFTVGLQVLPGRVASTNTVIVSITDATGKPVTNAKVQLIANMQAMDMGTAIEKATTHSATYSATFAQGEAFSMTGLWDIGINFQVSGQTVQKVSFQVTIAE